jgi:glucose/arabinose dehydrogenase
MNSIRSLVPILASLCLVASFAGTARALGEARAELAASSLTYPLFVAAPDGDPRLFVVERAGRIRIAQGGTTLPTPFLDIQSQVTTAGEGGLLGLAFAPDYEQSGLFYVYYTNLADDSVVSRFSVSGDPNLANPSSQTVLLTIDQPAGLTNHKGGTIAFGPDGFLWFATGDGGGSNDPNELAQNPQSLLGKMLRLDAGPVFAPGSIPVAGQAYRIPADNPFVGSPPRDEIWALGLRNPYRWSFDRETGDVWIADVGQGAREEVDFEPAGDPGGRNYGWDVMEGTLCNPNDPAPSPPCSAPSLTLPVHEYDHSGGRCSITGGYVFRSPVSPLTGLYFFGDYCSRQIWSLDPDTLMVVDRSAQLSPAAGSVNIVGFGEDGFGTLHVALANGNVYRILPADPACADALDNDGDGLADFPADPGCGDAAGSPENPACDDGLDNDGDGAFDWDGAGLGPPDPQCEGDGWRTRERRKGCGAGFELALLLPALQALRRRLRRG